MRSEQTSHANHPCVHDGVEKYLVLTANTTCDGEDIDCYQVVMISARDKAEAIKLTPNALQLRNTNGCIPVAAYTAAELRKLADDLETRELAPRRSYNLSLGMTDEQVAEWDKDEDKDKVSVSK